MSANPQAELSRTLALLAGAATSLAVALPAPGDTIARVIATGLGVVGLMLREGATVDEAIAAIRRVRHIDTRADDAAVDAKVAAKPSGIADTLPAPSGAAVPEMQRRLASLKQEASVTGDAERVEYLQTKINVIERELRRRGTWGEPGEGG